MLAPPANLPSPLRGEKQHERKTTRLSRISCLPESVRAAVYGLRASRARLYS